MTNYTYSDDDIADLHEKAYGFKPSPEWIEYWNSLTQDGKQIEWNLLNEDIGETTSRPEIRDAETKIFEDLVSMVMSGNDIDRKDAIKVIIDREGLTSDFEKLGYEPVEFEFGLDFGYIERSL